MTSPKCRLFLVTPTGVEADRLSSLAGAALAAGDVASLLVSVGVRQQDVLDALKPMAHKFDVALLVEGDFRLAKAAGADGVHLTAASGQQEEARSLLGQEAVVGVDCGSSRHAAMTAGEAGVDYVAFSRIADQDEENSILKWWAEIFEIPAIVLDPVSQEKAKQLIRLGADFIRPSDAMWQNEQAAAAEVGKLNVLIEDCVRC